MKIFYFNIQSKGGAGKSMLTYLQALKHETNDQAVFVDLDSSTKTSVRQLRFIGIKKRFL
jgi:cellulose biosynthesis protein BcsQ